jgi:hypothetical protein
MLTLVCPTFAVIASLICNPRDRIIEKGYTTDDIHGMEYFDTILALQTTVHNKLEILVPTFMPMSSNVLYSFFKSKINLPPHQVHFRTSYETLSLEHFNQ